MLTTENEVEALERVREILDGWEFPSFIRNRDGLVILHIYPCMEDGRRFGFKRDINRLDSVEVMFCPRYDGKEGFGYRVTFAGQTRFREEFHMADAAATSRRMLAAGKDFDYFENELPTPPAE